MSTAPASALAVYSFIIQAREWSDPRGLARRHALVAGVHARDGLAVPLEIDLGRLALADAIHEFVDQPHPLVEVGVLHRIAVVRSAVVVDVRTEAVALDHTLFARDGHVDLHALREDLPAGAGHLEPLLQSRPRRIEKERRAVLEFARRHDHVLHLQFGAEVRRDLREDGVVVRTRQPADQVEDVRVVAERAAAEAFVSRRERHAFAVARLGAALPRERPHRRQGNIGRLDRQKFSQFARGDLLLQSLHDGVVVHFELDLADDPGLVDHFDHPVVLVHVEGRDLHRKDVDAALGAELHLLIVLFIRGRQHDGFDVGVFREHLFGIEVAGNAGLVELVDLLGARVGGARSDPIELLIFQERLVIFAGMAVGHAHHRDLYGFQSFSFRCLQQERPCPQGCYSLSSSMRCFRYRLRVRPPNVLQSRPLILHF